MRVWNFWNLRKIKPGIQTRIIPPGLQELIKNICNKSTLQVLILLQIPKLADYSFIVTGISWYIVFSWIDKLPAFIITISQTALW